MIINGQHTSKNALHNMSVTELEGFIEECKRKAENQRISMIQTDKARDALCKTIEEAEAQLASLSKAWKPEIGDDFYYLDAVGNVVYGMWGGNEFCEGLWERGNCYRTKEEAEYVAKNQTTNTSLLDRADWVEGGHYTIFYNVDNVDVIGWWGDETSLGYNLPRFATDKSARAAIEAIGEQDIIDWLTPYHLRKK